MAGGYGGQLVALDVEQPNLDLVSPLARVAALKQQQVQTQEAQQQLEQEPLRAEALRLANAAARQKNVAGQQANTLGQMQLRDALIGGAAARALDSDSWDQLMSEAVKNGAPEAAQFIGRYNPILAQRIAAAYGKSGAAAPGAGGAGGGEGGTQQDQQLALQFQGQSPQQLQQGLQKSGAILQALSMVKDPQSYEQAVQWLTQNGVPEAAQYSGRYDPLFVSALYNHYLPIYRYLQGRVLDQAAGIPTPPIPQKTVVAGDVVYGINPEGTKATALTQWIGSIPEGASIAAVGVPSSGTSSPSSDIDTFVDQKLIPSESAGLADAKNPNSSAGGLGQFTDKTWEMMLAKHRPDLIKGKSQDQILAMKNDPDLNRDMTRQLARDNAQMLSSNGQPVTTLTVGLAHVLGSDAVQTFLNSPPATSMDKVVSPAAMKANPQFWNHDADGKQTTPKSVGEVWQMYQSKWGNSPLTGEPSQDNGVKILARGTEEEPLTGDALDYVAQQYVQTGQLPAFGMGKAAAANRRAVMNRAAEIEKETGATGYDAVTRHLAIKSAASTLTKVQQQQAQVKQFEDTARMNGDQVLKLLDTGPGPTGAPIFDRWVQAGRRQTGDPDISRFDTAVTTFANEYARVMSGGTGNVQLSDAAKKEAEQLINTAMSAKQLRAVIEQMNTDMDNRSKALDHQVQQARAIIQNGGVPPAAAQAGPQPIAPVGAHTVAQLQTAQQFRGTTAKAGTQGNPLMPNSEEQYKKLPKGSFYIYIDGSIRRKS